MDPINQPLPDAESFTSKLLQLNFYADRRNFTCFHCGSLPKPGDVLLVDMESSRIGVWIVQEMKERTRGDDSGFHRGIAEPIGYLEDVTFDIPQPAKLGFIIG